jgi:guanylate kinase
MTGVLLYGTPGTGKNTVTAALAELDARYQLFQRAKHGPGRTTGYRMISAAALAELRGRGEVIWENHRYGATYVVDRPQLQVAAVTRVPVVHLGQVAAVAAVLTAAPELGWLTVELWCPRPVATHRIHARGTGDETARLAAFDQTDRLPGADLRIDTSVVDPHQAARRIHAALTRTTG